MSVKIIFSTLLILGLIPSAIAQLTGPPSMTTAQGNFGQFLSRSQLKATTAMADKSAAGFSFNNEENTKGTRFLFNDWVKGDSLMTKDGSKMNVSSYFFNYDKLNDDLLASEDKKNIIAIGAEGIQSFALASNNRQYNFEHINTIDSTKFFLALVKNAEKYSLYKQIEVKFVPLNYKNDGMIETGTRENEYKDESRYYIVMPDKSFRLVVMKPKVLKDILIKDKDKASQYINDHGEEEINEHFLMGLVNYVDK